MTARVQTLRSSTAGARPVAGTRQPGELYVNWPDSMIGVIDAAQNPQDLLAVRVFSPLTNYVVGDHVIEGGILYVANTNITPGPFNGSEWDQNITINQVAGSYLPLAGGTLTGSLVLAGDAVSALNPVSLQQLTNSTAGFLPLSGGTLTGTLSLAGAPVNPTDAADKAYVDANTGGYLPLTGGTLTGVLNGTSAGFTGSVNAASAMITGTGTFNTLTVTNLATGTTPAPGDNTTKFATTAFVANAIPAPSGTNPAMDGTAAPGVSALFARGDHVHPTDTTRAAQASLANYLPLAGGTISGTLGVNGYTTLSGGAATYNQVTTHGLLAIQAGSQVWASAMSYPAGTLEVYNCFLRSSYWIGMLPATPNSFGSTSSYTWGAGHWGGWALGGASYDRVDTTGAYLAGRQFGTNSVMGWVYTDGASVYYNNGPSDIRLKDNVRSLATDVDVGALIDAIEPVAYDLNNTPDPAAQPGVGFIAQDLVQVVPEAVYVGDLDPNKWQGDEGFIAWGVDTSKLIPYLVAELKSLRARVAALEAAP
jgi:hypothetical protein